jgi:hypothetical protein
VNGGKVSSVDNGDGATGTARGDVLVRAIAGVTDAEFTTDLGPRPEFFRHAHTGRLSLRS